MRSDEHDDRLAGRDDRVAQVGYHVTVAESSYGDLVSDLVRPVLAELAAVDPPGRWFFVRDWREGCPAVYLLGRDVAPATSGEVPALARGRITGATIQPTGDLAGLDGVASGPRGRPVVEDMLCDSSQGLADLIAAYNGGGRERELALDLMIAHLPAVHIGAVPGDLAPENVPLSYLSYRYHADGFFLMCSDPRRIRAEMDERYRAAAASITERVVAVLTEIRRKQCSPQSPAGWWVPLVRKHLPIAIDGFRQGTITNGSTTLKAGWLGDTHDLVTSPLHQVIQDSPGYQHFLKADPVFQAIRLMTAVLYLSVHNAGLPLMHRYFFCHAVSRAVEEAFELDSADLAERIASRAFAGAGSSE